MAKLQDLTGQKFGKLEVIELITDKHPYKYKCICECGNIKICYGTHLKKGSTKSCGCYKKQFLMKTPKKIDMNKNKYTLYKGTKICLINKKKLQRNNTSGYTGVYWKQHKKKWLAAIVIKKKYIHLGYFDTKEEAIEKRKEAEEKYFSPLISEWEDIKNII